MKAKASILIDRPIDEVFSFVTNVENMPRWVTGVRGARLVSEQMGDGARFVLEYVGGWRPYDMELEVFEYDPPRAFAIRTSRGPFQFDGRMELETVDGGTRVTNIIEAGPDSLSTRIATVLLGPILGRSFGRRLEGELRQLASAIVGGAPV